MAQNHSDINSNSAKNVRFVHLHVHSAYSVLEGALTVKDILNYATTDQAPAVAITDTNNLFGSLEFTQYCFSNGVQPIIGCQLAIDYDKSEKKNRYPSEYASIVLLAANETGYNNLVHLVSRAYLDTIDENPPHILFDWLPELSEGLIVLTGGAAGPINRSMIDGKKQRAIEQLQFLQNIFGNRLYIELQRHAHYDRSIESSLVELAYQYKIPLVATNDVYFKNRDSYEAHDALLAVNEGQIVSNPERRRVTPEHYLKSQDEMIALFKDIPEAVENTVEIALRCHAYAPTRKPILPRFTGKAEDETKALQAEADELSRQAKEGLKMRLKTAGLADGYSVKDYEERLDYEISIITRMQFPGYFLIVADFIKWAKTKDIPVGPGRGSGAGSLVAYALTITDVDPLRFSLLFERFLNPDRVSMPDFDIDFCQDRREEVIQYVQEKYGQEQVAQIITIGKLQARQVLRDVGRALAVPFSKVDLLSKLVPQNPGANIELAKAIREEPKFLEERQNDPIVGELLDIAMQCEGLYRHTSIHAAGIVIGDRPLWQLVPMYRDRSSIMPVTQYTMKYVEQAGLVKFDFLGLKTLTVLKTAVDLVKRKGIEIDLPHIPLDDSKTYEMMARGETVGVFQVESAGMRKALIGMKPDRIEDIIALVALYRPGPMENIPTYNARKHGDEEIASIHPKIDYLIKETQGVIVYQEQVMQIAQVLSGYSLGEADLLRRAMGKKIHAEMEQQRSRFVDGAVEGGVDKKQANSIFDLLAKFADYGFNKSHAAAYALISYKTAYLKAHHPVEFLAASMTYDMNNTEKLNDFRREAIRLGIDVVRPCVQTSHQLFEVGENAIYYSLSAIKGVGVGCAAHIVNIRGNKPFKDLEDFCERIDMRIVNKRVMESLINAGAFDCFNIPREVLMAGLETIMARSLRILDDNRSGQGDIFAQVGGIKEPLLLPQAKSSTPSEKLHLEFQAIGFYLSAHPLDEYKDVLNKMRVQNWRDFSKAVERGASAGRLAGTVNGKQIKKTKTGKKMGIVQFSDSTGQYEAILFSESLNNFGDLLAVGQSVVIIVEADKRPEGISLRIQNVLSLEKQAQVLHKKMTIFVESTNQLEQIVQHFETGGDGLVSFVVVQNQGAREVEIALADKYKVSPQIAGAIKALPNIIDVELL